jgi:hypothetical protein
MLSVFVLGVVMLDVVRLSVVVPLDHLKYNRKVDIVDF